MKNKLRCACGFPAKSFRGLKIHQTRMHHKKPKSRYKHYQETTLLTTDYLLLLNLVLNQKSLETAKLPFQSTSSTCFLLDLDEIEQKLRKKIIGTRGAQDE